MLDPVSVQIWTYRGLFLLVALALVFLRLLPVNLFPTTWLGPDLMTCLAFAWIQRRPEYLPPLLLAGAFLVADLLLMRPPGLWAALVLLGAEFLRSRQQVSRELPFLMEWLMTGLVLTAMTFVTWALMFLAGAAEGQTQLILATLGGTLLAYPLAVVFSRGVLGVRQISPGETDRLGRPL